MIGSAMMTSFGLVWLLLWLQKGSLPPAAVFILSQIVAGDNQHVISRTARQQHVASDFDNF